MSALSELIKESKGLPAAFRRDHPKGTVWAGKVERLIVRQARDDDGLPRTWDDGNPVQEVVVAIHTDQRDPEKPNDDGVRGIYIKWWGEQKKAFIEAMTASGVEDIEPGGLFAAQYVDDGPQPRDPKLSKAKIMKYEYKAPSKMAGLLGGAGGNANGNGNGNGHTPPADPWSAEPSSAAAWNAAVPPDDVPLSHPAPTPAPAAAPPAPAGAPTDPAQLLATIKMLIGLNMTDDQISAATGAPGPALAAIRALGA